MSRLRPVPPALTSRRRAVATPAMAVADVGGGAHAAFSESAEQPADTVGDLAGAEENRNARRRSIGRLDGQPDRSDGPFVVHVANDQVDRSDGDTVAIFGRTVQSFLDQLGDRQLRLVG